MNSLVIEYSLAPKRRGRKPGHKPAVVSTGNLPHITRLMALAVRFEGLVRDGVAKDYADLARLGHVTRARLTQIMNLLLLAPDLQQELLFLPKTMIGRDSVSERSIRRITAIVRWDRQRKAWREMRVGMRGAVRGASADGPLEVDR